MDGFYAARTSTITGAPLVGFVTALHNKVGAFAVPELPDALRDSFSACEMQATVAGAMGHDLAQKHLGDILAPQLLDPGSVLRRVMRFTQLTVDADVLRDKLNALSPEALAVLQSRIGAMFKEYSPVDLFAGGYLPAIDMLRVAGLVAPVGKAWLIAWRGRRASVTCAFIRTIALLFSWISH